MTAREVPERFWVNNPQARRMLNVYHFVYRDSGFDFRPSREDLIFFEWLGSTNRLPSYLKWKTANILARAVGSPDLVPCPLDFSRIPPSFDYYFQESQLGMLRTDNGFHRMKLARRGCPRYVRFCFSLYQSKAASLPAEDWEIQQNIDETAHRISQEKFLDGPLMTPACLLHEDDVLAEVRRTVVEVFPQQTERVASPRLPSRGAVIGSSRSNGGALGSLIRTRLKYDWLPYEHLDCFFEGPRTALPVYSRVCDCDLLLAFSLSRQAARSCDFVPAIPVGIPEPFKVRVITKGWGPNYEIASAYQPRVWSQLKDHPTFRLVGQTLSPIAMSQFAGEIDPRERDHRYIISGDYKQATDHIPSHISRYIEELIAGRCGVPLEDVPVLLSSLVNHVVQVSGPGRCSLKVQRSGQLMGSPSSFPVLCIYNAALSRLAVETSQEERSYRMLHDLPMLVNGDDLILAGDLATYLNWKRIVNWAGLKPSVGKTLVSKKFGTINSSLYRFDDTSSFGTDWVRATHIPHLQLQLALGSMKSGRVDLSGRVISNANPISESRMWHQFMDSCRNKSRGWRFLFGVNRIYLRSLCQEFPRASLVLPPEAGGLGFPLPPPQSGYLEKRLPRNHHLTLARMLLEEGTEGQNRCRREWLSSLNFSRDRPSEGLLLTQQSQLQRLTSCPMLLRSSTEEDLIPPPHLSCSYALHNSYERGSLKSVAATFYSLDKELKKFVKSGRGPWTISAVFGFLRDKRWTVSYGRYSRENFSCRSYPHMTCLV